jgi:VCBS repeat-containing protein
MTATVLYDSYGVLPSLSPDGKYLVFWSTSPNVVANDTNGVGDVFVDDLVANSFQRISIADDGTQGNNDSFTFLVNPAPLISADGRYVVFASAATNLVSNDPNGSLISIFIYDRTLNHISIVPGEASNQDYGLPSISADGRYIAFDSLGVISIYDQFNNTFEQVPGTGTNPGTGNLAISGNGQFVVYAQADATSEWVNVYNRTTQTSQTISTHQLSFDPSISDNGRYVAYEANDSPGQPYQIYLYDSATGITSLVSHASDGTPSNVESTSPVISGDGKHVYFVSGATNLGATNNGYPDIYSYDVSTQKVTQVYAPTVSTVYGLTTSDDGRYLAFSLGNSNTGPSIVLDLGPTNQPPTIDLSHSTVTGIVNELPLTTGSTAIDYANGASATTPSGVIAFSDPDTGDRPTASVDTTHETITWTGAGGQNYTPTTAEMTALEGAFSIAPEAGNTNTGKIDWTYASTDSTLDFLGAGETVKITVPVIVDDQNGGTVTQVVVVTINGADDRPVANPDAVTVLQGGTAVLDAAHGVLADDTDPDIHDTLTVTSVSFGGRTVAITSGQGASIHGHYGTLTLSADGSYRYVETASNVPSGAQDTFSYTVNDGHGGTASSTLDISILKPVTLTGGTVASEMVELAAEVYNPQYSTFNLQNQSEPFATGSIVPAESAVAQRSGWLPVSASELGMPATDDIGTLQYSFVNGLYQAIDTSDTLLPGLPRVAAAEPEADAMVLIGDVNGQKTLAIVFRGTDQIADFLDYLNFGTHFTKFQPLLEAIQQFLSNPANGITQVLASGNSLGGSMVDYVMSEFPNTAQYAVQGYTDGNPGVENPIADTRIENFVNTGDPIPTLASLASSPIFRAALVAAAATTLGVEGGIAVASLLNELQPKGSEGTNIAIDNDLGFTLGGLPNFVQHYPATYAEELTKIVAFASDTKSPFHLSPLASSLVHDTIYSNADPAVQVAVGKPGSNVVHVYSGDNYVLGFSAAFNSGASTTGEQIVWDTPSGAETVHVVDGGPGGHNSVQLPYSVSQYTETPTNTTNGPEIELYFSGPPSGVVVGVPGLIGELFRITTITFTDSPGLQYILGSPLQALTAGNGANILDGRLLQGQAINDGNGNDTVYGGTSDKITIGSGHDIVYAGLNDTIVGGRGSDKFAFGVSPGVAVTGSSTIFNFSTAHDVIELSKVDFSTFASVMGSAHQVASGTQITIDANDNILLVGVNFHSLHAADFQFVI